MERYVEGGMPPSVAGQGRSAESQSFGHVDTSSKMGAFTSMWKDPKKGESPRISPGALARSNVPSPCHLTPDP